MLNFNQASKIVKSVTKPSRRETIRRLLADGVISDICAHLLSATFCARNKS